MSVFFCIIVYMRNDRIHKIKDNSREIFECIGNWRGIYTINYTEKIGHIINREKFEREIRKEWLKRYPHDICSVETWMILEVEITKKTNHKSFQETIEMEGRKKLEELKEIIQKKREEDSSLPPL